jgi:hypothetical protein
MNEKVILKKRFHQPYFKQNLVKQRTRARRSAVACARQIEWLNVQNGVRAKMWAESLKPKKTWTMAGRPDKSGRRTQLEIGLYEYPKCHNVFRGVLSQKKI